MNILERIETEPDLPQPYAVLLQDIRRTVVDMPVKHVRNVRGDQTQLFTVYHEDFSLMETDFESLIQKGSNQILNNNQVKNYLQLQDQEHFFILIAHHVYEELSELRFWIDSIITKHWYEECIDYEKDPDNFSHHAFFRSLSRDLGEREPLDPYRDLYRDLGISDFYTGGSLREFDVDHFLPWSRLPVNRFWNLVPTRSKINQKKSDRLIVLTDEIREQRLPEHIDRCLHTDEQIVHHDLRATYQKYFNGEIPDDRGQQRKELRNLVLQLYDNLETITVEEKIEIDELEAA